MYSTNDLTDSYYGAYGGTFLPESLMAATYALADAFEQAKADDQFQQEYRRLLEQFAGRATPLMEAKRLPEHIGGPRLLLKREDLLHTGAHKINNAVGQCLLAKRMGKIRIIAETGAGQHGVATATVCAQLGLPCVVYMGAEDIRRQLPNVERMRLLGAEVVAVETGRKTLKDAVNAAMRDYAASFENSHYCLGSALGPYPYPQMVAYFQSVIGKETRQQCQAQLGRDPDYILACVGGGSNAIGMFSAFIEQEKPVLIGVEAGGNGNALGQHAARFISGSPGVLHGCYSYVLQDEHQQIAETHSISAGLDYPMIGPQHAALHDSQRVQYAAVSDNEALTAFKSLSRLEGIIPALESAHALAYYFTLAKRLPSDQIVLVNLSGRGDKDLPRLFHEGLL